MQIKDKAIVSLRYVMKNTSGEILDNTMDKKPVQYLHGSGKILPSLESLLYGLKAGDKKSIRLKANEISANDDVTFDVIIDAVRFASKQEMELGQPAGPHNFSCDPECNCS